METVQAPALSRHLPNASPFGLVVAGILDDIWALYNYPGTLKPDTFSAADMVTVTLYHGASTFDFDGLTQLVVRCHDACVRLSIEPCNMRYLKLRFSARRRDGSTTERHPTMEQAVERVRSRTYFDRKTGVLP